MADVPPASHCLTYPYDAAVTQEQAELKALYASLDTTLKGVPSIGSALAGLRPTICLDPAPIMPRGYFDAGESFVALKQDLSFDAKRLILIHEFRHVDQLSRGFCPANSVSMQENARATMAFEADAMAIAALLAWDLRTLGDAGPWEMLLGWESYADIAHKFENERSGGASLQAAVEAAFAQWYVSDWRVDTYYVASCSDYLDRLDDTHALQRYGQLPGDFLDRLCRMPGGARYTCREGARD